MSKEQIKTAEEILDNIGETYYLEEVATVSYDTAVKAMEEYASQFQHPVAVNGYTKHQMALAFNAGDKHYDFHTWINEQDFNPVADASQTEEEVYVWVKASERLPDKGGYYFVMAGPDKALWTRSKLVARTEMLKREGAENHIQWLSLHPSQTAGNDAVRLIKELLMFCEDGKVIEGFRTKEIISEMRTLTTQTLTYILNN